MIPRCVASVCPRTLLTGKRRKHTERTPGHTHRSPGAGPPLVPTEHVGAARAAAPGTIILVLERMLSEASVWRPPRAWGHGTLLVSFWDIVWVALTRVDHVVTIIDTHHLPSRPTLSARHGAL